VSLSIASDQLVRVRRAGLTETALRVENPTAVYRPGSPWENGYYKSLSGRLRDERLSREIFYPLRETQIVIELWRVEYNTRRSHSARGRRPPAPQAVRRPENSTSAHANTI